MKSVFETLYLRRPKIEYVCPPVCEVAFSASGGPVIVLADLHKRHAPSGFILGGEGNSRLSWDAYPGALCYTVYKAVDELDPFGAYQIIAECINDNFFDPDDTGWYRVSVITPDGESDLSDPVHFTAAPVATCGCGDFFDTCPDDITDLVGWYQADCFKAFADNSPVGGVGQEWADLSGAGGMGDLTVGDAAPRYRTNIFGTRGAIEFSAGQNLIIPACPTFGDFTVLAITKVAALSQINILGNDDLPEGDGSYFLRTMKYPNSGLYEAMEVYQGSSGRGGHDILDPTLNPATAGIGRMIGFRRTDCCVLEFSKGTSYLTVFPSFDAGSFSFTRVGRGGYAYAPQSGHIAEICVWDRLLTDDEIADLGANYFVPKYGLT